VEHAYGAGSGTFHLRVGREADLLKMEVSDQGRWRPERPEDPGHGLKIMQDLADTMNVDRQPSGTTVRLAVRLGHAPAGPMSVFSPLPEQNRTRDAGRETGQVGHAEVHMNARPLSREGRCEIRQVAEIGRMNSRRIELAAVERHSLVSMAQRPCKTLPLQGLDLIAGSAFSVVEAINQGVADGR